MNDQYSSYSSVIMLKINLNDWALSTIFPALTNLLHFRSFFFSSYFFLQAEADEALLTLAKKGDSAPTA